VPEPIAPHIAGPALSSGAPARQGTAARADPRRPPRIRALDPDRLLRHGGVSRRGVPSSRSAGSRAGA
jgi:hypothetical protein